MVAEGHWDSQKASRRETRTTRASAEVQGDREVKGDRQERGQEGEEIKDTGAQRREEEVQVLGDRQKRGPRGEGTMGSGAQIGVREDNSGGGSMMMTEVGGDRAQWARQRAEVGCHWSGSKSGGDTESGSGEPESENRSEVSEVQSDTKADGRSGEDGEAEAEAETTQGGIDGSGEGLRGERDRGDQVQQWKLRG